LEIEKDKSFDDENPDDNHDDGDRYCNEEKNNSHDNKACSTKSSPGQNISTSSIERIRVPCVNEEEEDGKNTQYRDLEKKFVKVCLRVESLEEKQKSNEEIILELRSKLAQAKAEADNVKVENDLLRQGRCSACSAPPTSETIAHTKEQMQQQQQQLQQHHQLLPPHTKRFSSPLTRFPPGLNLLSFPSMQLTKEAIFQSLDSEL